MSPKATWHDLPSGLNDNFEMEITHSIFGTMENYNDNSGNRVMLLIWDYESPDHEAEFPIIWPCGSGWEMREQGRTTEHPKRDKFIKASIIGRLITRVVDDLKVEIDELGETWESDLWVGLKFFMKREKLAYPGAEQRGLRSEIERLMPTNFLGDTKGRLDRAGRYLPATGRVTAPVTGRVTTSAPAAAPATAPTRAPRASSRRPAGVVPEQPPAPSADPLLDRLVNLAKSLDSHDMFMKTALRLPELTDDDHGALLSEVLDAGPGGLWATTRAAQAEDDLPL